MTFGSRAMRDSTLDNCGSPVIEMPMRMCATLSRLSVTVVMPLDADFLIRQGGADVAHQAAAVESLDLDVHRKLAVPPVCPN